MIDNEFHINTQDAAAMVTIVCPTLAGHKTDAETKHSLMELGELLSTLGIETTSSHIQNKKKLEAGTILGTGKLQEIAEKAKAEGAKLLVFDFELTSSQVRNIKKLTDLDVIDRCQVILEIFAAHARTRDAKISIEISRLNYILPRLSGMWSHLSRQKGGVGVRGGEGEQQIELDRRIIRDKLDSLKKELKEIKKSRIVQKKRRQNNVITVALVGYTNAGKSSLMNRLCKVDLLEEDKLFATLDSTFRTLTPDTKPPVVLVDTVGFISNLPNTLIEGFKTTLESAIEADLLLIVCDMSDPNFEKHLQVTDEVLNELDVANKERLLIFNKRDLLTDPFKAKIMKKTHANSYVVSSFDKEDMSSLREQIIEYLLAKQNHYDLFIPYERGDLHAQITSKTNVIKTHNHDKGIFYRIRVPDFIFKPLGLTDFILAPDANRPTEF